VTTVSRKLVSFSCLNESGWSGSTTMRESRAGSSNPSSRSNSQARFCCAIKRRCSRLASRATTPCRCESCLSREPRRRPTSAGSPIELLGFAQILGRDRLVVLGDEGPVIRPGRLVLAVPAWAPRLGRALGVAHLGVVGHLGGERVGGLGRGVGHVLARDIGFIDPRLRVLGVGAPALLAGFFLTAILLAFFAFLLVWLRAAVFAPC